MIRSSVLLISIAFTSACSTPSSLVGGDQWKQVELTDKVTSYKCTFIGLVTGTETSPWDDAASITEKALQNARENALQREATHVVLQGSPQIIYNAEAKRREATVTLNAYKCKK